MRKYVILLVLSMIALGVRSQDTKELIREGNRAYKKGRVDEALAYYEEAAQLNEKTFPAFFNMGNVYYEKGKWKEAEQAYLNAMAAAKTKMEKAESWHNLGNVYLSEEKYPEALKAFKESLKLNPKDEDTRYNLAYTITKLNEEKEKQKKQEEKQQNQDKKENQEKDRNQKNQEQKGQENKEKQEQKGQKEEEKKEGEQKQGEGQKSEEKEGKEQDQNKQEGREGEKQEQKSGQGGDQQKEMKEENGRNRAVQIDPKQAERLLKALEREEGKIQEGLLRKKARSTRTRKSEKDW